MGRTFQCTSNWAGLLLLSSYDDTAMMVLRASALLLACIYSMNKDWLYVPVVCSYPNSMSNRSLSQSRERIATVFCARGNTCVCRRLSPFHFSTADICTVEVGGASMVATFTAGLFPGRAAGGAHMLRSCCFFARAGTTCVEDMPFNTSTNRGPGADRLAKPGTAESRAKCRL